MIMGIKGGSNDVCGFNDVWSNSTSDYEGFRGSQEQ